MADLVIHPDTKFIQEVTASGGGDLKKCFQCATCSTVCTLSPEDSPFPRKQMIEAQWGLKDRVLSDPAIWLCHNCGDCTTLCPRGARPGDVFGALRQQAIQQFARPGFLGRMVNSPKALALLVLLPVLLFGLQWATGPETAGAEWEYAHEFPLWLLEAAFFTISGLVVIAFIASLARFVGSLREHGADGPILANLIPTLKDIVTHKNFSECGAERNRYWGHMLTLWGFVGLAFVGTVIGMGSLAGIVHTPLAQTDPLKILANISAVVLLVGALVLLGDRVRDPVKRARSTYFDWFFLIVLTGIALTGLASELLREFEVSIMYQVYFVHLVLVFMLFVYAPYSKLAHLAYRTVALAAMRKKMTQEMPAEATGDARREFSV